MVTPEIQKTLDYLKTLSNVTIFYSQSAKSPIISPLIATLL